MHWYYFETLAIETVLSNQVISCAGQNVKKKDIGNFHENKMYNMNFEITKRVPSN